MADRPLVAPTRDAEITYYLTGANRTNGAEVMKMTIADKNQKVRLDLFNSGAILPAYGSIIFDEQSNHVLSLLHQRNAYLERPVAGLANPALMLNNGMQFTRIGTAVIAQLACTDWQVSNGPNFKGTACVTDDGLVLRATRTKPDSGTIVALSVNYTTPAASLFQPDPGSRLLATQPPGTALPGTQGR